MPAQRDHLVDVILSVKDDINKRLDRIEDESRDHRDMVRDELDEIKKRLNLSAGRFTGVKLVIGGLATIIIAVSGWVITWFHK